MTLKAQVLFVAAHGPAFSGKDSVCKILANFADHCQVVEARFAEPIYEMVRSQVPEANSQMSKEDKERLRPELGGLSVRQAMVAIGEGFRQYDKECWIKLWRHSLITETVQAIADGYLQVVVLVPDLRKADELKAFDNLPADLAIAMTKRLDELQPSTTQPLLQADTLLFHIYGQNAPENAQVNEATETRLAEAPNDLLIINDHSRGKEELRGHVWGVLGQATDGRRGELIIDLFKRQGYER